MKTKLRRPAIRFGIRALLVFTVLAALPCSWLAKQRSDWMDEQKSLDAMSAHVAFVQRSYVGPNWMYQIGIRPDFLSRIHLVDISGDSKPGKVQRIGDPPNPYCKFDDSAFTKIAPGLQDFEHLSELYLDQTQISDTSLKTISQFPHVSFINIQETDISESALHQLETEMPATEFAYHYNQPAAYVLPNGTVAKFKTNK